ncbi:MAG: hypothetical protein AAF368_02790, partial [Planctomycetota bacterium]
YVGLTNPMPTPSQETEAAPHRHLAESNPFPFFYRMELILGSLAERGIELDRIRVVPFFIDDLSQNAAFVPADALHLLSECDNWQREKLRMLRTAGLRAEFAISQPKTITGTEVRRRLRANERVDNLVPNFVARYLAEHPHPL